VFSNGTQKMLWEQLLHALMPCALYSGIAQQHQACKSFRQHSCIIWHLCAVCHNLQTNVQCQTGNKCNHATAILPALIGPWMAQQWQPHWLHAASLKALYLGDHLSGERVVALSARCMMVSMGRGDTSVYRITQQHTKHRMQPEVICQNNEGHCCPAA
jgi:hypothetical protein